MATDFKKVIPANVQLFLVPLGLLVVLIILSVLAVKIGFSRIGAQREELSAARKNESILSQKESVLSSVQGTIPTYVKTVAASLPEKNPALSMTSQLRSLALTNQLILENIKVGSSVTTGELSAVDISFSLEGAVPQVVSYLNSIKDMAPVSTVEKAKINQSSLGTRADVTVKVYFSPFPTKLPSLTEPVKELSQEEKGTLLKLSALSLPIFTELQAQPGTLRENPFD